MVQVHYLTVSPKFVFEDHKAGICQVDMANLSIPYIGTFYQDISERTTAKYISVWYSALLWMNGIVQMHKIHILL